MIKITFKIGSVALVQKRGYTDCSFGAKTGRKKDNGKKMQKVGRRSYV